MGATKSTLHDIILFDKYGRPIDMSTLCRSYAIDSQSFLELIGNLTGNN